MKKTSGNIACRWVMVFLLSLIQAVTWAQDSSSSSHTEITTKTTTTTWYAQPWVWVVGAAIFIIILVALFRGNSSRTDVSRSTTVVKTDREV
ncbi:MAG TPA: hypothetical protein VFI06_15270 [Chitinophagaceae bacterium]|nr:hypothetical protein [Chitinophagaceae bacterium]